MSARGVFLGLALALTAPAVRAQAGDVGPPRCDSPDPASAIAGCTALIQQHPSPKEALAAAYSKRGVAYLRAGRYDPAIADFTKAIALAPDFAEAWNNRATAYGAKGRYDRAIADATRAIALKPDYPLAYSNRARARHLKGQDAEALTDAEKAAALAPTNIAILRSLAEIHETLGRRDAAVAEYRAMLKLDPDQRSAMAGLKRLGAAP